MRNGRLAGRLRAGRRAHCRGSRAALSRGPASPPVIRSVTRQRVLARDAAIAEARIDIVIGTQLVAKGHHFPGLTLVGVVDADLGLADADPRAGERTFQLLQQVIGRAGRGASRAAAIVQTLHARPPVMRALAGGDDRDVSVDTRARSRAGPAAAVWAAGGSSSRRGPQRRRVCPGAGAAGRRPGRSGAAPAPAPLAMVRGRYRFRLLVMCAREWTSRPTCGPWLKEA